MTRHGDSGFTLVEILVAVLITGIVFSFILTTLTSTMEASKESRRRMEIDHAGRFFVERITAEITSASLLPFSGRGGFVGRHFTVNGKSRDEIHFTSFVQTFASPRPRAGVSEISYFFRAGRSGREALVRREDDNVEPPVDLGGDAYELSTEVDELSIKYRKAAGTWMNTWDAAQENTLPTEISVELRLRDGADTRLYSTIARPQS